MSTRSLICKENPDHTYTGIYCHFDGYPEGVGAVLISHYKDRERVERLLALGDLSSLDERLAPEDGEEHSFDNPTEGICVAYHRDRGEELRPASEVHIETAREDCWAEFVYVFGLDNKWRYVDLCCDPTKSIKEIPANVAGNYYDDPNPDAISFEELYGEKNEEDLHNKEACVDE